MRRVTSFDVARAAGVSQPTVSRALRDSRGVAEPTRTKVRVAARELGYVPLQSGRALATRLTKRVGIVTGELGNPFYPALVGPMITALHAAGYLALLIPDDDVDALDPVPLIDGSLDGVLLTTVHLGSGLPGELARRGVPCVLVNRETAGAHSDASIAANEHGARQVAQHLADLGHTRIGFIGGLDRTSTNRSRLAAFARALRRRGIDIPDTMVINGSYDVAHGRRALEALMTADSPPTAVFCANDVLALGAMEAARERGLAVPGDVSLIGFDDMPFSGLAAIGLTSVRVDLQRMAEAAVQLLLSRIADPALPHRRRRVPACLVPRGTDGPPRHLAP